MKYLKTRQNKNGGVGHQWMNWQLGAVLAEKWNYGFVHSSLDSKRSGGSWDEFLNFGEGYLRKQDVDDLTIKNIPDWDYGFGKSKEIGTKNLKKLKKFLQEGPDETVYEFPHNKFQGIIAKDLPIIIPSLREKYYSRHKNPTENDQFVVSFHLRRGDIDPDNNSNRWIDNEFYIEWIDRIKLVLDQSNIDSKFVLFSTTGRTGEFEDFPSFVELRIDGNPFEDFNYMVYSDVLFAGLSSYSILAATLNENFCFYCPLQTYTLWMEDQENYINVYEKKSWELEKWIE